jgi:hypothetical protein
VAKSRPDLGVKAAQIHNALLKTRPANFKDPTEIAHTMRTTAVVEAVDDVGQTWYLVASSEGKLTTAQLTAAKQVLPAERVIEVTGLKALEGHAEGQAFLAAEKMGLRAKAFGASREICLDCAAKGAATPAVPDTPMKMPH